MKSTFLTILISFCAGLLAAYLIFNRSSPKSDSFKAYADSIQKENSKHVTHIKTLQANSLQKDSVIAVLQQKLDSVKNHQKEIVNSFKPIYNEINNTADSGQLDIMLQLLARIRENPLERE